MRVQGRRYCIVVRGKSHVEAPAVMEGTCIETHGDVTVLTVGVRDSSHLCGLLDRLRDLDVDIVSVDIAATSQESNEAAGGKAGTGGTVP